MFFQSVVIVTILGGFLLSTHAMDLKVKSLPIGKTYLQFHEDVEKHHVPDLKKYIIHKLKSIQSTSKMQDPHASIMIKQSVKETLLDLLKAPPPAELNVLFIDLNVLFHEGQCGFFKDFLKEPENLSLLGIYGFKNLHEFYSWGKRVLKKSGVPYFKNFEFYEAKLPREKKLQPLLEKLHKKGYEIFGLNWKGWSPTNEESFLQTYSKYLKLAGIDFSQLHQPNLEGEVMDRHKISCKYTYDQEKGILSYNTSLENSIKAFVSDLCRNGIIASIYKAPQTCSLTLIQNTYTCHSKMMTFCDTHFEEKYPFYHFSSILKRDYEVILHEWLNPENIIYWQEDLARKKKFLKTNHHEFITLPDHMERAHNVLKDFLETFAKKSEKPCLCDSDFE